MATAKSKGPDKAEICKKLTSALKKKYTAAAKYPALPVMETMLYSVCLDNNTAQEAQELLNRVLSGFHDLNEMRVSSIEELEDLIHPATQSDLRAIRMRDVLHHVFEIEYKFEYEGLKRKTLEQAVKTLGKIKSLSWFCRAYVLSHCLGAHILPIDDQMHAILCWLGLGVPGGNPEQTAEGLRGFIRKSEGPEFCHVLRLCSNDPANKSILQNILKIHEQGDWEDVATLDRLASMLKGVLTRKKPPAKKVPVAAAKGKAVPKGGGERRGRGKGKEKSSRSEERRGEQSQKIRTGSDEKRGIQTQGKTGRPCEKTKVEVNQRP